MMSTILLDTNAYSAYRRGDERVLEVMAKSERVLLPAVVLAKLLYGLRGSSRDAENRMELSKFLAKPAVRFISAREDTADAFAVMKTDLRRRGFPKPTNDAWVAAHTQENGAVLVTFDRHFLGVPGLRVWVELR